MDKTRLNRIDKLLQSQIDDRKLAGASVAIYKDGEVCFDRQYGYADIESSRKIEKDTIFRLYSCTKPITATAMMILFERGEVELEYPLWKYIPSYKDMKIVSEDGTLSDCKTDITIRDLLNMTSGLVYPGGWFEAGRRVEPLFDEMISKLGTPGALTTQQFAKRMSELPLFFEPGEMWNYGTSADVLGAVIEIISGMKLSEFMKKEIFEPLGMCDTGFYVPKEKWGRFSKLYMPTDDGIALYEGNHLGVCDYREPPAFESGGAGLVSTIPDYLRFTRMLLNGGELDGVRILSPNTVSYMTQNHMTKKQYDSMQFGSTKGCGYGSFLRVVENTAQATTNGDKGEYGWDGWTGTYFTVNPKRNLIIIYFIQKCGTGMDDTTKRLRQIVYSADF
ncbi:MAG: beta-lactamase family protein [Ruminococcus sp.]|nr:beta-lactamase family protein [Ruminococcus sp.]